MKATPPDFRLFKRCYELKPSQEVAKKKGWWKFWK